MVLQPLENEARQQAFFDERQRQNEEKSSGGFWHENYIGKERSGRKPLRQKAEEKKQSKSRQMQEIFHTKNAYGEISLGMNPKGETMLVAGRSHYRNGPTVQRNEKELDEQNSYSWRGKAGNRKTNVKEPAKSAYALNSTKQHDGENRHRGETLLLQSQLFAQATAQHNALSMLPEKSDRVGDTKEKSAREMKLSHQLELALRLGEKQIVRRHSDDGIVQSFVSELVKTPEEDEEDRGEDADSEA
ncbi:MAG: hypothetical protein IJ682_02425 [Lachnospiraceae bacterium]|nr:hypothetical protein [Lachnospiraceae bacterium]